MAIMIRNENELATLRCSIRLSGRVPMLVTQAFIGAEQIGSSVSTPLVTIGLAALSERPKDLRKCFDVGGTEILDQIGNLHFEVSDTAAIWLQLSQDSHLASLVPWEQIIRETFNRTTLRIPNFLRTPYRVKERARLAICTSGAALHDADAAALIARQLSALEGALADDNVHLDVTIFAAAKLRTYLRDSLPKNMQGLSLHIAKGAKHVPDPQSERAAILNPWLRWIGATYRETGVDGVHFITPGHLSGGDSALVLPEPINDGETPAGQFVGLSELAAFYDRLGGSNMCFTPIGSDASKHGVRTMGYQMSWTRPGSLIVDEPAEVHASLMSVLRATWTDQGLASSIVASTPTYLHPSLAKLQENEEDAVAPHPGRDGELAFQQMEAKNNLTHSPFPPTFDALEAIDTATDAQSTAEGTVPPPIGSGANARQMIQNERAKFSSVKTRTDLEQARDQGALDALDFLDEVLSK